MDVLRTNKARLSANEQTVWDNKESDIISLVWDNKVSDIISLVWDNKVSDIISLLSSPL